MLGNNLDFLQRQTFYNLTFSMFRLVESVLAEPAQKCIS